MSLLFSSVTGVSADHVKRLSAAHYSEFRGKKLTNLESECKYTWAEVFSRKVFAQKCLQFPLELAPSQARPRCRQSAHTTVPISLKHMLV